MEATICLMSTNLSSTFSFRKSAIFVSELLNTSGVDIGFTNQDLDKFGILWHWHRQINGNFPTG